MITVEQQLKNMLAFTKTHEQYSAADIYQREVKCLEQQFSYCVLPLRDQDLLAGRILEHPIGFSPQSNASVGYYCNTYRIKEMLKDPSLSKEQLAEFDYLLEYWKDKTTCSKIIASYSEDIKTKLQHGDFETEKGIGYPLYRMSGAQMDPTKLLERGIVGMIEDIHAQKAYPTPFYDGLIGVLKVLQMVCMDYSKQILKESKNISDMLRKKECLQMSRGLENLAYSKPETFWEATQLAYLFFTMSGTINYGRLDEYLGSFYVNDLKADVLTENFALKILKNMWSLISERKNIFDGRVIIGGRNRRNPEDADQLALLAIEATRQRKEVIPQLTLRIYDGMNKTLLEKAYECIGEGATFPILYNDEVNIPSVEQAFDINTKTAEYYVPFGCGEYVLYNKGFGTPSGAINLLQALNEVIYDSDDASFHNCTSFEEFYQAYLRKIESVIEVLAKQEKLEYDVCAEDAGYLFFSLIFDDCMERGKPVFQGGIHHLGGTLECYGNTNTADSLTAIKTLVFDKQLISKETLIHCLKNDYEQNQQELKLLREAPKYGNDDDISDDIAVRFHRDLCLMIRSQAKKVGLDSYLAVVINNSMNTTFGLTTGASADGRRAYTFMANANNPTGGMDKNGITALLNSLVKLETNIHAGSVQNMRFSKEMFTSLLMKTKGLLGTYFAKGGAQAMITVINRGDLERAMKEPEQYQHLIVRVGGFSARFVELSPSVQKELLSRTLY